MSKKKILITGGNSMLAYDFIRSQGDFFSITSVDKNECDITSFESILQSISIHEPDIVLNCAAYTAVDDAEDIGMKMCYEVNTLGVHNLARATAAFGVDLITISTDYVFDGKKSEGYLPGDVCDPINAYGMSKYLGEKLAKQENSQTIIVRTSWLYGGNIFGSSSGVFKNFVNTMLKLSETRSELKVVAYQHGVPTSCMDLSSALAEIIQNLEEREYRGQILHFSNSSEEGSITWADFAREIFLIL
ncbi:NAD(P)-dependent oxidoreductase, partial [Candidatus Gracilibacteria bacterium]|nr:NAD(P)-dependent oxidoreductase [Candidatus Gracilibacteria bacterium]